MFGIGPIGFLLMCIGVFVGYLWAMGYAQEPAVFKVFKAWWVLNWSERSTAMAIQNWTGITLLDPAAVSLIFGTLLSVWSTRTSTSRGPHSQPSQRQRSTHEHAARRKL